jgi:hypothetical protein
MTVERNRSSAPRRGASGLTWAVLLIGAGVALLLENMGVVQIHWLYLLRFWPVLLILAGLDFLLGRRSFVGGLLTAALGLMIVAGVLWLATDPANLPGWALSVRSNTITREVQTGLAGADTLDVSLDLGATSTTIGAHDDSQYALLGEYTTDRQFDLGVEYEVKDGKGDLSLQKRGEDDSFVSGYTGELSLTLPDAVPIDLMIDSGVGTATLNLDQLEITALDMSVGVGTTEVVLGPGSYTANLDTGIGAVTVDLPDHAEVRVESDGGLRTIDLPERFEKIDDGVWETPGYDTAADRILLRVDTGIGSITITG